MAPQEQPRELRGLGHVLGETAEQFFSVGSVGELVRACDKKDWKTVKHLAKTVEQQAKVNGKEFCDKVAIIKQGATGGTRQEYGSSGEVETMRADTFTLDGGHLVKIRMIYAKPIADVEGFHPKSFDELFAGLREAYGEPSKSYSEPVISPYGAKLEARVVLVRERGIGLQQRSLHAVIRHDDADAEQRLVSRIGCGACRDRWRRTLILTGCGANEREGNGKGDDHFHATPARIRSCK